MVTELLETEEKFEGNSYEIIAWAQREQVVCYVQFGSYQGEWVLVSRTEDRQTYKIYKGSYGSCSGCDSFEAVSPSTRAEGLEFVREHDYIPFLEIPTSTMRNLCANRNLIQVFPANFRDEFSDVSLEEVVVETLMWVLLEEGLPITSADILATPNQELRRRGVEAMGAEKFFAEAEKEVLHEDGENALFAVGARRYLYLKDASTERRYLLQVPPDTQRVKQGIAWTFGMSESDYSPLVEA